MGGKCRNEKWLEILSLTMEMRLREMEEPEISSRKKVTGGLKGIATKFGLMQRSEDGSLLCYKTETAKTEAREGPGVETCRKVLRWNNM